MLFDQVQELPVATLRRARRSGLEILVGRLHQWVEARWAWVRPRTIPLAVALAGMFGVLHTVDYLSRPAPGLHASSPGEAAPAVPGHRVRLVLDR